MAKKKKEAKVLTDAEVLNEVQADLQGLSDRLKAYAESHRDLAVRLNKINREVILLVDLC